MWCCGLIWALFFGFREETRKRKKGDLWKGALADSAFNGKLNLLMKELSWHCLRLIQT